MPTSPQTEAHPHGLLGDLLEGLRALPKLSSADALARVAAVVEVLPHVGTPDRLADALPPTLAGLADEVVLALSRLALALAGSSSSVRLPLGRDELAPVLRAAWLRVELALGVQADALARIDDGMLLWALVEGSLGEVSDADALLRRMACAEDPRLRLRALELLDRAVAELSITATQACALSLTLAEDPEPRLRRAAIESLDRAYLGELPTQLRTRARERLAAGLDHDEVVMCSARVAARWRERELLVAYAFDAEHDAQRRCAVLAVLGPLANEQDLSAALALADDDPLRFGASVRELVLAAHRHGVFLREPQLPAILRAFDAHTAWTAVELVRVTHIVRAALVTELARLPADDPRWIRRAAMLSASIDDGAAPLLAEQLRACEDTRVAVALIDAAARAGAFDDEAALLAWLPRLPEQVIPALRVKGREQAAARLRELVVDRRCPSGLRSLALDAAWALCDDRPALLRELATTLGPRAAGLLASKHGLGLGHPSPAPRFPHGMHLSSRDASAAMILRELDWDTELEPLEALKVLCEAGKPELLPALTRLFRQIVTDYVGEALAGDFTIKRVRMPELEQLIYRCGRHLIADGRSVRRFVDDTPDTGDELLLAIVIEWLLEDPPAPICVALLETLARKQVHGAALRRIESFWRHRELEVRRAALEAIVAAGEHARGLELSIARLAADDEPKLVRQALLSIASLGARWAEPLVIDALARPQMLIKREAASALAVVGSSRCVPSLVAWLARHDNASFRGDLLRALQTIAGEHTGAILLDALRSTDDPRGRGLLREALDRQLTLRAALRLARQPHPAHDELLDAMLSGTVALADASAGRLAAALHRAKLRTREPKPDPCLRLRASGFSEAAALELLEQRSREHDPDIFAVVREGLAEWLTWLASVTPSLPAALELVLEAARPTRIEHQRALFELVERTLELAPREPGLAPREPGLAPREPSLASRVVVEWLERLLASEAHKAELSGRALALLRALPGSPEVGGLRRFELLAALGAVRSRADLDRCLADCMIGPDAARDSARLLEHALRLPAKAAREPDELTALREQIASWYRMPTDDATAWLSEQLRARPLGLPVLAPWPRASKPAAAKPSSREQLDELLQVLDGEGPGGAGDRQARARAAEQIVAWPEVRELEHSWSRVLARYLADEIDLSPAAISSLAATLDELPAAAWTRTRALFEAFDVRQRRACLPGWIRAWERGEADADARLRGVGQELLIPIARARAQQGDYALLQLLQPSSSPALRELVEYVAAHAPAEVEHLLAPQREATVVKPLGDPLDGHTRAQLVELIGDRRVEVNLAVRAIHRLATLEDSADVLAQACLDRRARVRSASLRALRRVAPRERCLAVSVELLGLETRRDVIASLLASIAHARYEPGFAKLLEQLSASDTKLVDAAEQALLAWGASVLPLLVRAARKARPDRRPQLEAIIATLQAAADA